MSITLPKDALIDNGNMKKRNHRHRALHSAPADQSKARRDLYSAQSQAFKPGTSALLESTNHLSQRKSLVIRENSHVRIRSKSAQEKFMVAEPTLRQSSAVHVDVNIPTAGEEFSVLSSANLDSTLGSDNMSRSCDLDDVRSEDSEELREPTPLPPVPEVESTQAMKDRIHQDLIRTLSDTDHFLQVMDHKRKNKPPQISYSDDEDVIDVTHSYEQTAIVPHSENGQAMRDIMCTETGSMLTNHVPYGLRVPHSSEALGPDINSIHSIFKEQDRQASVTKTENIVDDDHYDDDYDPGFLPRPPERKNSAQIFLDLVHQIEQDDDFISSDESEVAIS